MPIRITRPTGALLDLLLAEEERGIDVHAPSQVVVLGSAEPPGEPLVIEPYDGSSFITPPTEPVPPPCEDDRSSPAKPTPRLNKVRAWQSSQLRPA